MHPDFYFILYYIHCIMLLLHLNNILLMSQKKSSSLVLCEAMAGKPPAKWPPPPPCANAAVGASARIPARTRPTSEPLIDLINCHAAAIIGCFDSKSGWLMRRLSAFSRRCLR